jgi:methyl-accepting chemotaxis protein
MNQEAKKSAYTHSEKKHQDNETIKSTVHGIREGVEIFKRTADDLNHKAAEGIGMCSEKIGALFNSGTSASRCCMNISNEIIENCNRTVSELSEISQEALSCRTIDDLMELQKRACEQLSSSYLDMANKISRMAFDAWAEALTPALRQADTSAKHMRKAA